MVLLGQGGREGAGVGRVEVLEGGRCEKMEGVLGVGVGSPSSRTL